MLMNFELYYSQTEKEDMVRKSTNLLLTRTLSGCLATLIKRPGLRLLQLIQITINTLHLEHANVLLENYVAKITGFVSLSLVSTTYTVYPDVEIYRLAPNCTISLVVTSSTPTHTELGIQSQAEYHIPLCPYLMMISPFFYSNLYPVFCDCCQPMKNL